MCALYRVECVHPAGIGTSLSREVSEKQGLVGLMLRKAG